MKFDEHLCGTCITCILQTATVDRDSGQVLSNFIHQRVIEKKQKIIYNKHQNTIDMQDYQVHAAYKINCK